MRIGYPTKERRVYLGIRVPPALKKRIEDEARAAGQNLTAVVESLLLWALARAEKSRATKAESRHSA